MKKESIRDAVRVTIEREYAETRKYLESFNRDASKVDRLNVPDGTPSEIVRYLIAQYYERERHLLANTGEPVKDGLLTRYGVNDMEYILRFYWDHLHDNTTVDQLMRMLGSYLAFSYPSFNDIPVVALCNTLSGIFQLLEQLSAVAQQEKPWDWEENKMGRWT